MVRLIKIIVICIAFLLGSYFLLVTFYIDILAYIIQRPVKKSIEIEFPSHQTSLYLKTITRGIDFEKKAISPSNGSSFNSQTDYIFKSSLEVFFEVTDDTLKVYVLDPALEPSNFNSKIVVKQIVLENPEYMGLFQRADLRMF